jgi:membrane protein DedA with SNARE-associated domain
LLKHLNDILVAFGPWGIFLLNVADSLGIPLPAASDLLLLDVAATSTKHPSFAYFAALMAVLGSIAGNMGLFLAARQGGRWMSRGRPAGDPGIFRVWFNRYGLLTVFVPAVVPFVPLPLKVFVITAGAMHTPVGEFLIVIVLARAIRYFGEAYLGLTLGSKAGTYLASHRWPVAIGVLAAIAAGILAYTIVNRRRQRLE